MPATGAKTFSEFLRDLQDRLPEPGGPESKEAFVGSIFEQLFVVMDWKPSGRLFWSVKAPGEARPISTHEWQNEAIEAARVLIQSWSRGGSLRIQDLSGRFREERTYPRSQDPSPPRG